MQNNKSFAPNESEEGVKYSTSKAQHTALPNTIYCTQLFYWRKARPWRSAMVLLSPPSFKVRRINIVPTYDCFVWQLSVCICNPGAQYVKLKCQLLFSSVHPQTRRRLKLSANFAFHTTALRISLTYTYYKAINRSLFDYTVPLYIWTCLFSLPRAIQIVVKQQSRLKDLDLDSSRIHLSYKCWPLLNIY